MTRTNTSPDSESSGKRPAEAFEPPSEKTFAAFLRWHLRRGTRPGGSLTVSGDRWDHNTFATAIAAAYSDRRKKSQDAGKNLRNWLSGHVKRPSRPWATAIEKVLFGSPEQNSNYEKWRDQLRGFSDGKTDLSILTRYVKEPIPRSQRELVTKSVAAELANEGWRLDRMDAGDGLTHPAFNLHLLTSAPVIRHRDLNHRWRASDYQDTLDLEKFVVAEAESRTPDEFFNGDKIRLASDFVEPRYDDVRIQETDYVSSLMTDQLAWTRVQTVALSKDAVSPRDIIWDGLTRFIERGPSEQYRLLGFGENKISNQVGASTLAFSKDGHLMIVCQNKLNLQSAALLAPSGSGSLDWSDVKNSGHHDLLSIIRYGANRELREECALDANRSRNKIKIESEIIVSGFVRMLHRAGKPEFYCLARIEASANEICSRRPERYVEQVIPTDVTPANWDTKSPSKEITRLCKDYLERAFKNNANRVRMSYPLEHSINLLIEACRNEKSAKIVDQFFRSWQP